MVSEEEIAQAHNEFKTKFMPQQNKENAQALSIVMAKQMRVVVDDSFEFWVSTKILPRHMRLLSSVKIDEANFDYDKSIEPFANFLADICIDKTMTKEWWLAYNEETGYIPGIVNTIMSDVQLQSPKIEVFR